MELSEYGIQYKPRLELEGQVLAYFLAELSRPDMNLGDTGWWILNANGSSRQTGAGIGFQLKALTGETIEQAIRLHFPASNNQTEYEAILVGIDLTHSISSRKLIICSDSQLVVG